MDKVRFATYEEACEKLFEVAHEFLGDYTLEELHKLPPKECFELLVKKIGLALEEIVVEEN